MPPIISVENLGKKYTLGHQVGSGAGYRRLSEDLRDLIVRPFRSISALRTNRRSVPGEGGRHVPPLGTSGLVGVRACSPLPREAFWALRNVSFDVQQGEVLGIIGRNGAGKSTLLKILSRITEPTEGRARLTGRVSSLLEVGTGFHGELTGRENIYLNGAVLGMTRAEMNRKFDEIVAFAGVEQFLDTPVKRYSSGMYLRLAFAVAAHLEPEILIVDEVLAVGDMEFQRKSLRKMEQVAQAGRTVLFVSHNMNAVERLCTRVLRLGRGSLLGVHDDVHQGILAYLQEGDCGTGHVWCNPEQVLENDYFFPERLEVASESPDASPGNPCSNRFPIAVTVSGRVLRGDPSLHIGIEVYTEEGQLLCRSFSTDGEVHSWPALEPGPVRLRVQIPSRFLNEGSYRVELVAKLHCREWLLERCETPSVIFAIQGGLSDSPMWNEKRRGLLAPVLRWEVA